MSGIFFIIWKVLFSLYLYYFNNDSKENVFCQYCEIYNLSFQEYLV